METIDKLLEIARYLGLSQIEAELGAIRERRCQENPYLILPLVGEFSSGKTSLINALTDSHKLETATKPTTATIYEVHFGCDSCHASVLDENNEFVEYPDISELKNDKLSNAKVVTVFDTSIRVPSTTILVDTPGLSSPDPKHKQTLVSFLPKADGVLLVTDINQQLTRSLTDFIDMMKLSKKPIFLILTKSDTKSVQDIETAKRYICENCQIPIKQVAVVSAMTDRLDELNSLFANIQKSKKEILTAVDNQRIRGIVTRISEHIDDLMKSSSSDEQIEETIGTLQHELDKINRRIDSMIDSVSDEILEQERMISRKFEDIIQSRLNALASGKSTNFDAEAISTVNSTSTLLLSEYKDSIRTILYEVAKKRCTPDDYISSALLTDINMDDLQISGLSYNLDLNNMGHEYDKWIKTGVIAVAAVGAVAVAATAAPVAAGAGAMGSSAISEASVAMVSMDNVLDVADTVTDVSSIVSNRHSAGRIEKATGLITNAKSQYDAISGDNLRYGQDVGSDKGIIDSIVGFATDKFMSKPQRVHAVRTYVDSSLSPEFKSALQVITRDLIESVRQSLISGASQIIEQKEVSLNQLKLERQEQKNLFDSRMAELKEFKAVLSTL